MAEGDHARCARRAELEPPRWCVHCRRRMVVQVTPGAWTATCVQHGTVEQPTWSVSRSRHSGSRVPGGQASLRW